MKSSDVSVSQLKTALEVRSEVLGIAGGSSRPTRLERPSFLECDVFDDDEDSGDSQEVDLAEPVAKKQKKETIEDYTKLLRSSSMLDGYKYIEKFNRDMMDQFMEYQRRHTSSYIKWEQERYRQEQLALEKWKSESREHEKQMFGVFCSTIVSFQCITCIHYTYLQGIFSATL